MVGQVLGAVGSLPDIYTELTIAFFLLRRLLGVKTEGDKRGAKVSRFYYFSLIGLLNVNKLTLSSIYTHFNTLKKKALGKHCGKR